ncbi:Pycsar system effector family protein [uncultured Desulfuromonas sp.]|uniref:Pycsar system effector family protein n=1 Tax=uncultured Desulfuromonas sp. TaxID=181013 RepID=UPI002AAC2BE5|nr:Pycsar system effector family protein [uncultured Desulfuromonas sp.]
MNEETPPLLPRLLTTNALRANLSKHMQLNQMADSKASMILTVSSLVITITLTQYDQLHLSTVLILAGAGLLAILFSILAIIPPLHASGQTNLFYFRSFSELSEEEFSTRFKQIIADKDALYDAYLHEIYYLGKHRLTRKYGLIRDGLWCLLGGLIGATLSAVIHRLPM